MVGSPPDTSILDVFANIPSTQATTIGELVDNSLDANATKVTIRRDGDKITIEDNGIGIGDIVDAVTLARHNPEGTKKDRLGRYGWGLPFCLAWWGYKWEILTRRDGQTRRLAITSTSDIKPGWIYPDVTNIDANGFAGTKIAITNTERASIQWKPILKEISWAFGPALMNGVTIEASQGGRIDRLSAIRLPSMYSKVTGVLNLPDGRSASYAAGYIKKDLPIAGGCVWLSYSHRNLVACNIGLGDFSALDFAAYVDLRNAPGAEDDESLPRWKLSANKTGIDDDQLDEIDTLLQPIFAPALERIAGTPETIEVDRIRGELNECVVGGSLARETREPKSQSTGTVKRKESGSRRRRARGYDTTKDGSVETEGGKKEFSSPKKLTYDFKRFEDQYFAGEFDKGSCKVYLNKNHKGIRELAEKGRKSELWLVAAGLVASCHDPSSNMLFDVNATAEEVLGTLVYAIMRENSK